MNKDKPTPGPDTTQKPDVEHSEVETSTSSSPVIEHLQDERKRVNPSTVPIDPRDPKQSP